MTNLLILCTGNACRSQITEGYFRALRGDEFFVRSAGIEAHGLNQTWWLSWERPASILVVIGQR